ncbi:uncharacterized protein LOC110622216 [Manihot esculenta]|uniref:Uncharacterized protein n=1 Tax=Manihot esculenta TaxID=3983 RepID=A0ACB7H785_MANES|nr:uncharacterized protein LOC110622216 [Manihot esculenta]XP_021622340.1 uncharacterized protein LOC110622216 [Manihot esculenta]XP_021622342.1 uncharacterized protein LOC110622216 [Manihot esculenta]KAG8648051.1 hypothetical protein MANES_09G143400v8 [Manihot esculenta]
MWGCRLQSDVLCHGSCGINGSWLSSNRSRSGVGCEQLTNHHHSISDEVLSYSDSLHDNVQEPRWTSPVQKFNLGNVATSTSGGSRSQTSRLRFPSTERRFAVRATTVSPSFASPSSLYESSPWGSTSKRPFAFSNCNFPSRRSYMSKAVYPLVFRNLVSDCETFDDVGISNIGRLTPGEDLTSPSCWLDNSSSVEYKFHKILTELESLETSPDPSASSRREGFRWSGSTSYDLGLDGDLFDVAEPMDMESLRSSSSAVPDQKCGVCGKLLREKSPWSSRRIMRGGDLPVAGVLSCSHVFHAECLEQATPKTQIHDPPCPLCLKSIGALEESLSVSEPLQVALRRRNRGVVISEAQGSRNSNEACTHIKGRLRKNWLRAVQPQSENGSSLTNRLKRHFTLRGKVG